METRTYKHIDLSYLLELSNGNNRFILEMISVFIDQTPKEIEKLENYLSEKNWKGLREIAHKIKPSFPFMGIEELNNDIKLMEEFAANETNLDQLPALVAKTRKVCNESIIELNAAKASFI